MLASIGGILSAVKRIFPLFAVVAVLSSGPAEAHHQRGASDTSGLPIPNLTHGQLRVMSRYQSAILDLANRQVRPDLRARTLQNFVNLQFAYCLWGLVPGSLTYEGNPFNECSHAYLAGSKALLDRLRQTEETRVRAETLAQDINLAMVRDGAALEICSNSFEPFNTAAIVMPEWANVSFNPLGLLLGSIVLAAAAGAFAAGRTSRPVAVR